MDVELKALEEKINQLVELTQRLRNDNRGLRQQLAQAVNENKRLGEKVDAAKARLEALLEHLPEGEQ
jgi:cell division protein ZapB